MVKKHTILGDSIKAWRQEYTMSQSDLANILGISDKTISSWETGRTEPSMGMLAALAKTFHCTIKELIEGEDPEEVSDKIFFEDLDRQEIAEALRKFRNNGENLYSLFKIAMNANPKYIDVATKILKALIDGENEDDSAPEKEHKSRAEDRAKLAIIQNFDEED